MKTITRAVCLGTFVPMACLAGAHGPNSTVQNPDVPIFDDLGNHHRPITTNSEKAQAYFDQGLRLIYGFNHEEAVLAFKEGLKHDPACAMLHWGIAAAKGPNYNLGMDEAMRKASYESSRKALELQSGATEKERELIHAMALRYVEDLHAERRPLDEAYSAAMRKLATTYPDDDDILTLYAESLMNLRPWQLWTRDGKPEPGTPDILKALETVLERNPNHPGANHFYIHATEASLNPEKALPSADRLGALMPGAGHMVHMPAHVYIRVGQYEKAIDVNVLAADVDRAYIKFRNPQNSPYPVMYFPHNIHFIWACAAIEGRSKLALSAARDLDAVVPHDLVRQMPMAEFGPPTPHFALVRFGRWKEMLAEPEPSEGLDFTKGMWHYGRGMAFGGLKKLDEAEREAAALAEIRDATPEDQPVNLNTAKSLLSIAHSVLSGDIERRRGNLNIAIHHFEKAVELNDGQNYEEPPTWYQPARQFLGAALLEANRPADAEAVYREDLRRNPKNGWSLFGLMQSLQAQKKRAEANEVKKAFKEAWARADVRLKASRF